MTTYRLTELASDGVRHVQEFPEYPQAVQALLERVPWHDCPQGLVIQQLAAFESTTWSQVTEGDEVKAPDGSVWVVDGIKSANGLSTYTITNVESSALTITTPQPTAAVTRRPGASAILRQMFADAGIATTIVR